MMDAVEWYLRRACRPAVMAFVQIVTPFTLEDELLVTIINSGELHKLKPRKMRMDQAIDILRKELDLGDQQAMWYWDDGLCGPRQV